MSIKTINTIYVLLWILIRYRASADTFCVSILDRAAHRNDNKQNYSVSLFDGLSFLPRQLLHGQHCWVIDFGDCYTFNVIVDTLSDSDSSDSVDDNMDPFSILFAANARVIAHYHRVHANNFSEFFCITSDLKHRPISLLSSLNSRSSSSPPSPDIFHRDRRIYNQSNNHQTCVGFKSTQLCNDILSIQLPNNHKSCIETVNFASECGYCECFGGKIMLIPTSKSDPINTCSQLCEEINHGCASPKSSPDAIYIPNTIVGCDAQWNKPGIESAIGQCEAGWHICESGSELHFLHLTQWMCHVLSPIQTFYASLDTTECGTSVNNNDNILAGCGENGDEVLPTVQSFCDVFSYVMVGWQFDNNDKNSNAVLNESAWHVPGSHYPLYDCVEKSSELDGGIMCCVDNAFNRITGQKFENWELILLAVAHAVFIVIFILTFAVICERVAMYLCIRKIFRRYKKWKQKRRINSFLTTGTAKKYRERINSSNCTECAICLEEYKDSEKVLLLNCGHHYHWQCGNTWLLEHDSCPQCLQPITQAHDLRFGDNYKDVEMTEIEIDDKDEERDEETEQREAALEVRSMSLVSSIIDAPDAIR